ncbi:AfsR/SARP family transcriptional regulator [Amycolatopsis cihanbeyliensis]|uniref:AfsR/SARP family transcriptional regulator n=1 Tax=Amycolatopsis cihanbeyliensis TaxID=1128664 RepID=UPI001476E1FF|nr:AfsR/SARP family transcriptional regulator [Amycolatopsis cihanbeyliensis]
MSGRIQLRVSRQSSLLTALILRANRVVSVEQLIEAVFGEDRGGPAAIYTYVSRIRRALNEVEPGGGERIVTRPTGYLLRIEPGELDVDVFRQHVERGRRAAAAGHWEDASEEYESGLTLWRDSAMVDVSSESLCRNEIARLTEERLTTLERRIAADLELGRHEDLIGELRVLAADQPLREQFWAQLMLALYRSGRAAEALDVYQQVRTMLADELGIDPGGELQRLHQAMLVNDPTLGASPAATPAVATPPVRPLPPPAQLPPDIVSFVGREDIIARVTEFLSAEPREAPPVVVFEGLPGVGKTTLAQRVAHKLRDHFPDGQLYVSLHGYSHAAPITPADVLPRFLRALGVSAEVIPLDLDEQVALYRSILADKRMLVVLDNAGSAGHVRSLIPAGEQCAVLVTCRDDLRGLTALQGARRISLDVLEPEVAVSLLATVIGDERVPAEPEAAHELARLCGYLPLALRIAAANLSSRPYREIRSYVAELRAADRLANLAIQGDEQAAVRAAFDLSYATLKPDEATLFRYLGLVPGPHFTTHAAAALFDTTVEGVRPLLEHLRIANLVQDYGSDRFHFHDLLRHYAVEQSEAMDSGEAREAAVRRLFSLHLGATVTASQIVEPNREQPEPPKDMAAVELPRLNTVAQTKAWMDAEFGDLQAALAHAAEHGPYAYGWRMAVAMGAPLALSTRFTEWVLTTQIGLECALRSDEPQGEAIMHTALGFAYLTSGHQALAIQQLGQALRGGAQFGNPEYEVGCRYTLGLANLWTGRLTEAGENLKASLELCRRHGFADQEADAIHGVGITHRYLGELDEALRWLTESVEVGRDRGGPYTHGVRLFGLGMAYRDLGRFSEALDTLAETSRIFQRLGNAFGESRSLNGLSSIYRELDRLDTAHDTARRSLALSREIKHRRTEADALNALAAVLERLDRLDESQDYYREALAVAESMGPYAYGTLEARIGLATVLRRLSRWGEAREQAEVAMSFVRTSRFRLHAGAALLALAQLELETGNPAAAAVSAEAARTVCTETGQQLGEARARQLLARLNRDPGATKETPESLFRNWK